jgi:hypothetical protein
MKKQVKKSGSLTKNVAQDGHGPWHPWASVGHRMPQDATGCYRIPQASETYQKGDASPQLQLLPLVPSKPSEESQRTLKDKFNWYLNGC